MLDVLRDLARFARPYPWALPSLVLLGLMASLAEGFGIGLLIPLLDTLLGGASGGAPGPFERFALELALDAGPGARLAALSLMIVALVGVKTLVHAADLKVATAWASRVARDLRVAASRQLLHVGYSWFARSEQGHLLNVLDTQTYRTSDGLLWLSITITSLCTVIVFLALLLVLSWQLTLVVLLCLVPALLAVRRLTRAAQNRGEVLVAAYTGWAGRVVELLSAMRTIRAFGQEVAEEARMAAAADKVQRSFERSEYVNNLVAPLAELLYLPAFLAVIAVAWATGVGLSSLLVFLLLLYRMQPALKRLDGARVALAGFAPSVAAVADLLRVDDKPVVAGGDDEPRRPFGVLRFEDVSFTYPGATAPAVAGLSFKLARGEVLAVAGRSGAGKSTLINLLYRFYDPASGRILVDGQPLETLRLASWRRRLALAGQDVELLAGSVRDNLAFGDPSIDDDAIRDALELASADGFVAQLPGGLDAEVGTRGARLSGGQRQRIALARALARAPELLVLDEATNAVDAETELAIQRALRSLAGRITVIVIAHRLSTLRIADRALLLADGRMVEHGPVEQVLRSGGPLAQLVDLAEEAP
jgi:subfamily B ATP-binding cassette protein MsbA